VELKGFREILLKKAEGNTTLRTLISYAKDDILVNKVFESLEKMARNQSSAGGKASAPVTAFGANSTNLTTNMVRDAFGHHASHYKNALKASQAPADTPEAKIKVAKARATADKHLNKLIPLMDLVKRAGPHSGGKLALDSVKVRPWEGNYTRPDVRAASGKEKEGTHGLGRRLRNTTRNPLHESHPDYSKLEAAGHNAHGVPDYRYLEMPAHPGHPEYPAKHGHSGYPFEEVQIGSNADIDAKEAYPHMRDVPEGSEDKFIPHAFDTHPIHDLSDIKQGKLRGPDDPRLVNYAKQMEQWHNSEPVKKYLDKYEEDYNKDPEAVEARNKTKPEHFWDDVDVREPEHHVSHYEKINGRPDRVGGDEEQDGEAVSQAATPAKKASAGISDADLAKMPPAIRDIYMKQRGK